MDIDFTVRNLILCHWGEPCITGLANEVLVDAKQALDNVRFSLFELEKRKRWILRRSLLERRKGQNLVMHGTFLWTLFPWIPAPISDHHLLWRTLQMSRCLCFACSRGILPIQSLAASRLAPIGPNGPQISTAPPSDSTTIESANY